MGTPVISLSGTCELIGKWPEMDSSIVGEVRKAHENGLEVEFFFGCATTSATVATEALTSNACHVCIFLSPGLHHLEPGDFISVDTKTRRVRVLFRAASMNNNFLVTEVCDNYCIMCSQPPRRVRDERLLEEISAVISRLPKNIHEIGFTGGEPTLRGDQFLEILRECHASLPATSVHVLSNGRSFSNPTIAASWAQISHPDLMVGIPLYSDQSDIHDYVVQADGAFDETIRGILNLKALKQAVELRFVLHRHTVSRIEAFAYFVARNLHSVDHVAIMGLELMGFAVAHADDLWIDPRDYMETIFNAASTLDQAGLRVSIYNLPLCVLDVRARRYAVRSISDWKREYWDCCSSCAARERCGGAFTSSRDRLEPYVSPISLDQEN